MEVTRTIIADLPFGILIVDRQKRIRRINRAALAMIACPEGTEVVGRICHEVICPAAWDKCPILDLGQAIEDSEQVVLAHDGSEVPILKTVMPVVLEGEEVLLECFVDITQRKQAEEAMVQAREIAEQLNLKYEMALGAAELGTWDWNLRTGQFTVSERWARLLGYNVDELPPRFESLERIIHPDDVEGWKAVVTACLDGNTDHYQIDYRVRPKSGDWIWMAGSGAVVERAPGGRAERVIGACRDITSHKQAEVLLREHQEVLRRQVEERTRDLREAQAALTNSAFESGRAQVSAMVLHNIGNAVTPLKVALEHMLGRTQKETLHYLDQCYTDLTSHRQEIQHYVNHDERGKEVFAFIGGLMEALRTEGSDRVQALRRMDKSVGYISEILSLQQSYAARDKVPKERADLNAMIRDALQLQSGALEKRSISIRSDLDEQQPILVIEKNKLMQVLLNIIKNSYESIDQKVSLSDGSEGENYIAVRTCAEAGRVEFEITDTGVGLEPEQIALVLEGGTSTKGSTGFGVNYCKRFVETNRGSFTITSSGKDTGATVRVSFNTALKKAA